MRLDSAGGARVGNAITMVAGWFGYELIQTHHVSLELAPTQAQGEPIPVRRAA